MSKILYFSRDRDAIREKVFAVHRKGHKVVFTNGCFDLFHSGHVRTLQFARNTEANSFVVVGLNSDSSVKSLKGQARPIISETSRAEILVDNRNVDLVIIFDEQTPLDLIKCIMPDVTVKGGDYKEKKVEGYSFTEVRYADYSEQHSTTKIIEKIKNDC